MSAVRFESGYRFGEYIEYSNLMASGQQIFSNWPAHATHPDYGDRQ
jgi:hypothetical protein